MQTYKFGELTWELLEKLVRLQVRDTRPQNWERRQIGLTPEERMQVGFLTASLHRSQVTRLNEATVWARAIYPLLVMAELPGVQAWAEVPMTARFRNFTLEGIVDGVLARSLLGEIRTPYLIVAEAKKGIDATDPQYQLLGQMLAAAWLNQAANQTQQGIFGCHIIAGSWTFFYGLLDEIEAEFPQLTVESSPEFAEKTEAETILQMLKFIAGKYEQESTAPATIAA